MDDKQSRRMERLLERVLEVLGETYDDVTYLNEGGMGAVFTGRHKRLRRVDAIKVLYVDGPTAEDALDRFRGEWQTIAALGRCPHIVSIYEADHDEERDLAWLTEEFVDGPSLKERMAGGRLPVREALDIAVQIANGLVYAHERGIIHRDIKPGNIIVDRSGDTLITDFGLARFQGDDRLTQTHMAVGTLAFMSPEALSGADPAPAMDVYSLGVVLFEMFTGQRLFGGANIIQQQMSETPKDPRTLAPDLPPDLAALILRMLAKAGEDRPTATEVAQQLEAIRSAPPSHVDTTVQADITDGAIPVRPAAPTTRTPSQGGSKRWLAVGGGAAGVALAAFLATQFLGSGGDATDSANSASTGNPLGTNTPDNNGTPDRPLGNGDGATNDPSGLPATTDSVLTAAAGGDTTEDATTNRDPEPADAGEVTQTQPADTGRPAGGADRPRDGAPTGTGIDDGAQTTTTQPPPSPTPALPREITLQVGVAGEYRRQVQSFRILVNGKEIGDRPGMYSLERPDNGRITVSLRRLGFMFAPSETTVTLGNRGQLELEFVPSPM